MSRPPVDVDLGLDLQAEPVSLEQWGRAASPQRRGWAAAMDLGLYYVLPLLVLPSLAGPDNNTEPAFAPVRWPLAVAAPLALQAALYLALPGRTFGKLVTGLVIVDITGKPARFARGFLLREAVRILFYGLGILPVLFAFFLRTPEGRFPHDTGTGTSVVRARDVRRAAAGGAGSPGASLT